MHKGLRLIGLGFALSAGCVALAWDPPVPPVPLEDGEIHFVNIIHRSPRTPYEEIHVGNNTFPFTQSPLAVHYGIGPVSSSYYYYRNNLSVEFEFFIRRNDLTYEQANTWLLSDVLYDPFIPDRQGRINFRNECEPTGWPYGADPDPLVGDGIDDSEGFSESRARFPSDEVALVSTTTLGPSSWNPRSRWVHYMTPGPTQFTCSVKSASDFKVTVSETTLTRVYHCRVIVQTAELSVENLTSILDAADGGVRHFTSVSHTMPFTLQTVTTVSLDPLYGIVGGLWNLFKRVRTFNSSGDIYNGVVSADQEGRFHVPEHAFEGATHLELEIDRFTKFSSEISELVVSNGVYKTPMYPGDLDGSNEIDAGDLDIVISKFGLTTSDEEWLASSSLSYGGQDADVDNSGEVDAADVDIILDTFGMVGS